MDSSPPPPALSVILPVYEAMPYLPSALRDVLKQRLSGDAALELLVAHDGGSDGSLDFLLQLVTALGAPRASDEVVHADGDGDTEEDGGELNPALVQPLRAPEGVDHASFSSTPAPVVPMAPLSVAEVAAAARPEHRLRLLRRADGKNRGQGYAMSLAWKHATAPFVAQMESDDERADVRSYATMLAALDDHPEWDAVSCQVELVGWERPGMEAYVRWQNALTTPDQMRCGRFIEIPALHQTCLLRRAAIEAVLTPTGGAYRDGPLRSAGAAGGDAIWAHGASLDTPVDYWWWLSFYHAGLVCGKVAPAPRSGEHGDAPSAEEGRTTDPAVFGWRQHPRQHTRTHGRLSLDNLRRIKAHFLLADGGPLCACRRVVVISVGATLQGWVAALREHPRCAAGEGVEVVTVSWAPGKKGNAPLPPAARLQPAGRPAAASGGKRKLGASEAAPPAAPVADEAADAATSAAATVRVWAFGREEVRRKVRDHVADFAEMATDVFVA